MLIGGSSFAIVLPFNACVVPQINGPVALFITSDQQPLANNVRDQAADKIIAGPTMAFIDTVQEAMGQAVRTGSISSSGSSSNNNSNNNSGASSISTTTTITPAEASALISSASATATAAGAAPTANNAAAAGGPNPFTGTVGPVTVQGWSSVPKATGS